MVVYMDPLGIRVPVSEGSKGGSRVFGLKAAPGLADTGLGLLGLGSRVKRLSSTVWNPGVCFWNWDVQDRCREIEQP